MNRLQQQLQFLAELDKLKEILRRSLVTNSLRRENSAEHSWHLAMMAIVLLEHAESPDLDLLRILKMLLIHDIVEIDAGDTFCYDTAAHESKPQREQAAADRIFHLLPPDQATELRSLWDEFESGESAEAKCAQAIDRLQPVLQNLQTRGAGWRQHGVTKAQVLDRNAKIGIAFPGIWEEILHRLDEAEAGGFFNPDSGPA